jgi:hypothetical protein
MIFILKIIPHMMYDEKIDLFNKIKEFYCNNEKGYEKLLNITKKIG